MIDDPRLNREPVSDMVARARGLVLRGDGDGVVIGKSSSRDLPKAEIGSDNAAAEATLGGGRRSR